MDKNRIKLIYIFSYILFASTLTCLFLIDDFLIDIKIDNTKIKYTIIISNNIFALINLINVSFKNKKIISDLLYLQFGLIFTSLADIFLVFGINYEIGVLLFIGAQISYLLKLMNQIEFNKKRLYETLIFRASIFIILVIIMLAVNMFNFLYVITMFYFTNLVMNLYDSIRNSIEFKNDSRFKEIIIFTIGLFLFILCDICVGVSMLSGKLGIYIWLFYAPSQILIVLSSLKIKENS